MNIVTKSLFWVPICVAVHLQSSNGLGSFFCMQRAGTVKFSLVINLTDMTYVWGFEQLRAQFRKSVRSISLRPKKTSLWSDFLTGFTLFFTDFCSEWNWHRPTNHIGDLLAYFRVMSISWPFLSFMSSPVGNSFMGFNQNIK